MDKSPRFFTFIIHIYMLLLYYMMVLYYALVLNIGKRRLGISIRLNSEHVDACKVFTLGSFSVSEIDKIGLRSTGTSLNPEYYLIMCLVSGGFKGGAPP